MLSRKGIVGGGGQAAPTETDAPNELSQGGSGGAALVRGTN